jgi:hypothetical protein
MLFALDVATQLIATALLLYGLYVMGNHKRRGPLLAALSEVLWVVVGIQHSIYGLVLLSVILAVMQARNFVKWTKEGIAW